jgi:uncharacterized protein (TIGR03437 family)
VRFRYLKGNLFSWLIVLVLSCTVSHVCAQTDRFPSLRVSEQTLSPGSSAHFRVALSAASAGLSGLQFDIEYDGDAMDLEVSEASGLLPSSKFLEGVDVSPGRKRYLITGFNQIPLRNGTLADLTVRARPDVADSSYAIRLSELSASDGEGGAVDVASEAGTLLVRTNAELRIDEARNAASLEAGPLAPGQLVTLLGSGFPESPKIEINGLSMEVLYSSDNQINAVVPFEIATSDFADLLVSAGDRKTRFPTALAETSPGLFTVNSSGAGQGTIVNEDLSLNSEANPALAGTLIGVHLTGAGLVDGGTPRLPVRAEIGGAEVQVAGTRLAPALDPRVLQVFLLVPQNYRSDSKMSVSLLVGTVRTQLGVTVAVRAR